MRPPHIHHCTSEPYRFFGRTAELALLDAALAGAEPSVAALVGPGGQGKTAIVQHWLERLLSSGQPPDGVFLWSFYRGKNADLCLRELFAYASGLGGASELSASYCVDHLLPILRRERWAVVFDGAEVAQYEVRPWQGRFIHPEFGRLLEELASEPLPGLVVLTTRFDLPTLVHRRHARLISLSALDAASARHLLTSLGVHGDEEALDRVAAFGGRHAKAVELLGSFLTGYHGGDAAALKEGVESPPVEGIALEEARVAGALALWQTALPAEAQDVIALATAFRDPPTEARLREYLVSAPVRTLLHETWGRPYEPFAHRPPDWTIQHIDDLVHLRLLERVGRHGVASATEAPVIDAHPLVRRAFEHVLGTKGRRQGAQARAGFLRGRPDRRKPATLDEAREDVEMFHAYCDAALWEEADAAFAALDNPKHRFLAPALERDLLVLFFPGGDWRRPPLWAGFNRYRSLAICLEMMGRFDDALTAYRDSDAALQGDALIALGRLDPLLKQSEAAHPWQNLWRAYRCHALCLAGRVDEAVTLARSLVPVDVYEWVHVFECLLRAGRLSALEIKSVLFRPPHAAESRWAELARRRMRADYLRILDGPSPELEAEYRYLSEAYDRAGLPFERCLTRLSEARRQLASGDAEGARTTAAKALDLAQRYGMSLATADARDILADSGVPNVANATDRRKPVRP
jgi:tetratricopeptide (TPR) repeat protein